MQIQTQRMLRGMAWLTVSVTAVTVLLRVWLLPTLRDTDTGLFSSGVLPIVVLLLSLAVLAVLAWLGRSARLEIVLPGGLWVSVAALVAGALLLISGLWDTYLWLAAGEVPSPQAAVDSALGQIALLLQLIAGILSGFALVRLGLVLLSEGHTRRGMAGWSMLLPVLWMWVRLARYEMSYVSAVRLSQSFYDVLMFVLELLFLFRLARYTAGAGEIGTGLLQFLSCGTAVFSLSGPLVRLGMYLLGDGEAFLSSQLAGLPDVAVGLLALALAFALPVGVPPSQFAEAGSAPSAPSPAEPVEESQEESFFVLPFDATSEE